MSAEDHCRETTVQLPSLEDNPVERQRLLNIQAQRRYRKRKQDKIQQLEAQLAAKEDRLQNASPQQLVEENQLVSFGSPCTHEQITSSSEDMINRLLNGTPSQMWEALPPEFSMSLDDGEMSINDTIFNFTSASSAPFGSTIHNPDPITPHSIVSNPANDFADYAVTTPGLSVMRAHVTIVKHLHGSDFKIDIWNPCTLSPFCFPNDTSSDVHIPESFKPTPLQKHVQHHPVVDCLPWKSFRDRFLYVMSLPKEMRPKIAQQDMPSVTLELMFALKDAGGGLRVWDQNPFIPENWEIGQTFYSRFWWAIDGDIIKHSNTIRAQRGELPLRFNVKDAQ